MDYQVQESYQSVTEEYSAPSPDRKQSPNAMATASLVKGILSLVLCCCFAGGFFGGLGVLFALLSRGDESMCGRSRTGMILSVIGIVLTAVFLGLMVIGFSGWTEQTQQQVIPLPPDVMTVFRGLKMGGVL